MPLFPPEPAQVPLPVPPETRAALRRAAGLPPEPEIEHSSVSVLPCRSGFLRPIRRPWPRVLHCSPPSVSIPAVPLRPCQPLSSCTWVRPLPPLPAPRWNPGHTISAAEKTALEPVLACDRAATTSQVSETTMTKSNGSDQSSSKSMTGTSASPTVSSSVAASPSVSSPAVSTPSLSSSPSSGSSLPVTPLSSSSLSGSGYSSPSSTANSSGSPWPSSKWAKKSCPAAQYDPKAPESAQSMLAAHWPSYSVLPSNESSSSTSVLSAGKTPSALESWPSLESLKIPPLQRKDVFSSVPSLQSPWSVSRIRPSTGPASPYRPWGRPPFHLQASWPSYVILPAEEAEGE